MPVSTRSSSIRPAVRERTASVSANAGADHKARARVAEGGVLLGVDYGRRRMGLALSDALGLTARPLATWTRENRRGDLARLRALCREHGVAGIVVGWPLNMDGTAGEMAQEAARFAERVRKNLGLPVELVDERLSSWEAEQALAESSAGRGAQKGLDAVAAAVILRDYLARARNTAQD